jgi:peroxiredoxin
MRRTLLLAVLVLAAACARSQATAPTGTAMRTVNEPLPAISGNDLQGAPISTGDFAGQVLVLNAWASWCLPYCAEEQPDLVDVSRRYEDRGVQFLGIDHLDQTAAAKEWVRHYQVPYPSIADPTGRVAIDLDYFGLPNTYVVDPAGTIRYAIGPGPVTAAQLSAAIDEVLASHTSASSATAANSPAK